MKASLTEGYLACLNTSNEMEFPTSLDHGSTVVRRLPSFSECLSNSSPVESLKDTKSQIVENTVYGTELRGQRDFQKWKRWSFLP